MQGRGVGEVLSQLMGKLFSKSTQTEDTLMLMEARGIAIRKSSPYSFIFFQINLEMLRSFGTSGGARECGLESAPSAPPILPTIA